MPGLSWSSLEVVAADGLVGERGVALRTPVLRAEGGRFLLPSRLEDETVEPLQALRQEEVRELIEEEAWIPVRPSLAKCGHVLVLRGPSFAAACHMVELRDDLRWHDRHGRTEIAYVERRAAIAWRARCADRFTRRAERQLGEHLALGVPAVVVRAQALLEMALFVTSPGTATRARLFVLLGIATAECSPRSWPLLASAALAESPGLARAQLEAQIHEARRELKAQAERPAQPAWATGFAHQLRPAAL